MFKRTATVILLVCVAASTAAAQQTPDEPGIFDGRLAESLWTVIAFAVLAMVLGKVAWKPLLNNLRLREDHIREQISHAEAARHKAEALLNDHKQKGLELYQQMVDRAQRTQRDMLDQALADASSLRQKAQADLAATREAAAKELWEEAADMVRLVTAEVLGRAVEPRDDDRLIAEAVEKFRSSELKQS